MDEVRAEFERWAVTEGLDVSLKDGEYRSPKTSRSWRIWQAAKATHPQPVALDDAALRDAVATAIARPMLYDSAQAVANIALRTIKSHAEAKPAELAE
jgi:hypothetical protein